MTEQKIFWNPAEILTTDSPTLNRRKYKRLKKALKVHVRSLNILGLYSDGSTIDVDPMGLCIAFDAASIPPLPDQVIEISIDGPRKEDLPIHAVGRVSWIQKKGPGKGITAGVKITYLKKRDIGRLLKELGRKS